MNPFTSATKIFFLVIFSISSLAFDASKKEEFENPEKLDPYHLSRLITKYKLRATEHEPESLNNLGAVYLKGLGVPRDEAIAKKYFLLAAERDFPPAMYHLGLIFFKGLGVTIDLDEAQLWFQKAAAMGDIEAQFFLAIILGKQKEDKKKLEESLRWFRTAAEQGMVAAQYNLAITLKRLNQSKVFDRTSLYWLNIAAEKLHFESISALYFFHYLASKNETKLRTVVYKLVQLAELGDERAQYLLGLSYCAGKGIDMNKPEGLFWIEQAALGGLLEAQENLEQFRISIDNLDLKGQKNQWLKAISKNHQSSSYALSEPPLKLRSKLKSEILGSNIDSGFSRN